jgi:hypothetical protein
MFPSPTKTAILDEWRRMQEMFPELAEWKFRWNPAARKRLGVCNHSAKTVSVSEWALERVALDLLLDTVRHEAAHALAGSGEGHGPVWKAKCALTGAVPVRQKTLPPEMHPDYQWVAECPVHGRLTIGWMRKPTTNKIHRPCGERVVYVRNKAA